MKNVKKHQNWWNLSIISASILATSCAIAPVNSQYESARSLSKNNLEVGGSFTMYGLLEQEDDLVKYEDFIQNSNMGLNVGYGITDQFDLKVSYQRYFPGGDYEDFDLSINYFSLSPKMSFLDNKLAVKLPFNFYNIGDFGGEDEGISVEGNNIMALNPTVMGTWPVSDNFEVGIACSYLFEVFGGEDASEIGDGYFGISLGFGISQDLERWAIRPEIGYQRRFLDEMSYLNFGVGFAYNFDLNK